MDHRIFLAINLPNDIRELLTAYQEKWMDFPAKWTKPENLHITLFFVGDVSDEILEDVGQVMGKIVSGVKEFPIRLEKIAYGPPNIIPPKMIWAIGQNSEGFSLFTKAIEKGIKEVYPSIVVAKRETIPHVTLGRIKDWEWRRFEPDERPEIGEFLDTSFQVKSVELMESKLKREGPEYKVIESYKLIK